MFAATVAGALQLNRLQLDDDMDEDDEDDDDIDKDRDEDDDEDEDDEFDDDEEEPETWQVRAAYASGRLEYSKRGTGACESPKGRLNLTFRPATA